MAYTTISRLKSSLKFLNIGHTVHCYIFGAGLMLYIAGSLRYRRVKEFCNNEHFVQCMCKLCTTSPCKLQWLKLQYPVQKAVWNSFILNIESLAIFWVHIRFWTWPDRCDIVKFNSFVRMHILCNKWELCIQFSHVNYRGLYYNIASLVWNSGISNIQCMATFLVHVQHRTPYTEKTLNIQYQHRISPCKVQYFTLQDRVTNTVWNFCILNIQCMVTFWLQVQCCR